MPVTARLSRLVYERLGDEIVNELVDWLNAVDATYRADLRELNELNFARFDAKLEQRTAALDAKIELRTAELASRFEAKLEQRTAALDAKIELRTAELASRIDQLESRLEAKLERRLGEQTRWFIAAWAVVLGAVIGLWFRQ